MNEFDPSKPKRRWYQFSLRTLMLLVLSGGMVFGWIGMRMRRAHTNRQSVAAAEKALSEIQKNSGMVFFSRDRSMIFDEYRPQQSATWLEQLFDDPGDPHDPEAVWSFSIYVRLNTDSELEDLRGLWEDLKAPIKVEGLGVNCDGAVAGLPTNDLDFTDAEWLPPTNVTDVGLEHLRGMTNLETISLVGSKVTDEGLENLIGLTNLDSLSLDHNKVTDDGLEHLKGVANLNILFLGNTKVTDEGVAKLQQALPNCTIHR